MLAALCFRSCSRVSYVPESPATADAPSPSYNEPNSNERGWGTLPAHLTEIIFSYLKPVDDLKTCFAVVSTCSSWRAVGVPMLFNAPWEQDNRIVHPRQLFAVKHRAHSDGSGASDSADSSVDGSGVGARSTVVQHPQLPGLFLLVLQVPKPQLLRCHVVRRRLARSHTEFEMWQEDQGGQPHACFLLSASTHNGDRFSIGLRRPGPDLLPPGWGSAPLPNDADCLAWVEASENIKMLRHGMRLEVQRHRHFELRSRQRPWGEPGPPPKGMLAVDCELFEHRHSAASQGGGRCGGADAGAGDGCMVDGHASSPLLTVHHVWGLDDERRRGMHRISAEVLHPGQAVRPEPGCMVLNPVFCHEPSDPRDSAASAGASGRLLRHVAPTCIEQQRQQQQQQGFVRAGEAQAGCPLPVRTKLDSILPRWNEATKSYRLDFYGRVKLASVKNFKLSLAGGSEVAILFGKVEEDKYVLEFDPGVMSAVQAFAIALTNFD